MVTCLYRFKTAKKCILHPVKKVPRGGECAQSVFGMLYNAFGLCIWCVVVCGHCVADLIYIGVMVC